MIRVQEKNLDLHVNTIMINGLYTIKALKFQMQNRKKNRRHQYNNDK